MAVNNLSVFGIYTTRVGIETAVRALKEAGFASPNISILFHHDPESAKDSPHENEIRAPEGAAAGAGTGAVTGGVVGWILGIGLLAIPGVGPLLAAGPLMAALACAGVGGALGSIAGGLIGLGISEETAKRYEGRIQQKGILLSVHNLSSELNRQAQEILVRTGAEDITSTTSPGIPAPLTKSVPA